MGEVILTEEQLQEKLYEWQRRLRLQDWIIDVRIKRARDIPEGTQACIHWVLEKKMASISILAPVDYGPELMVPQDMENSLVHELLHLHFAPISQFDDEGRFHIAEEQAIESITSGLLSTYRENFLIAGNGARVYYD